MAVYINTPGAPVSVTTGLKRMHAVVSTYVVGPLTNDYNQLKNLPTLNGVEMSGDKTAEDYKLTDNYDEITELVIDDLTDDGVINNSVTKPVDPEPETPPAPPEDEDGEITREEIDDLFGDDDKKPIEDQGDNIVDDDLDNLDDQKKPVDDDLDDGEEIVDDLDDIEDLDGPVDDEF